MTARIEQPYLLVRFSLLFHVDKDGGAGSIPSGPGPGAPRDYSATELRRAGEAGAPPAADFVAMERRPRSPGALRRPPAVADAAPGDPPLAAAAGHPVARGWPRPHRPHRDGRLAVSGGVAAPADRAVARQEALHQRRVDVLARRPRRAGERGPATRRGHRRAFQSLVRRAQRSHHFTPRATSAAYAQRRPSRPMSSRPRDRRARHPAGERAAVRARRPPTRGLRAASPAACCAPGILVLIGAVALCRDAGTMSSSTASATASSRMNAGAASSSSTPARTCACAGPCRTTTASSLHSARIRR